MKSQHEDAPVDLLTETAMHYVSYQEDELGKPVLKREYFWGIARHFTCTLVALAVDEAEPTEVVEAVLTQVRARALLHIERWRNGAVDDEEDDLDGEDIEDLEDEDLEAE
jgi:hypothetical protein